MRKKTGLLHACLFFLISLMLLSTQTVGAQDLVIIDFKGGFRSTAIIRNEGASNATDIHWTMGIEGEHFIFAKNTSGVIPVLPPGASEVVTVGPAIGFGKIFINVTASCAEGDNLTVFGTGFLLLFVMIGVKVEPVP